LRSSARRRSIRPHQHVANIAGDHLFTWFNAGPLLTFAIFAGTDLQAALAGDMLMRWSDDQLPSNFHRVRSPLPGEYQGARYSLYPMEV
jgi:hypothetical protein